MMPITQLEVGPWFKRHGQDLTDQHSFREMIGRVERERNVLQRHVALYALHAPDVVPECEAALAAAEALLMDMRNRLIEIGGTI